MEQFAAWRMGAATLWGIWIPPFRHLMGRASFLAARALIHEASIHSGSFEVGINAEHAHSCQCIGQGSG